MNGSAPLRIHQVLPLAPGAPAWRRGVNLWQRTMAPPLVIPPSKETTHMLLTGATGSGKSTIIRQLLEQIEARGDLAVVLDPACDFVKHFYKPERGDVIINPFDARMPYWAPGEELRPGWEYAESLTIAQALMPSDKGNEFFRDGPRKIFANLIESNPEIEDLVQCLTDGSLLDKCLKKELYSVVTRDAPDQRGGIMGMLSFAADTLSLLPTRAEAAGTWSARRWMDQPQGWVFLTSLSSMRARCVPLHSVILDALILRSMGDGPRKIPTWFVLDEVQTQHRLPQLSVGLTEGRKYNVRFVLGVQGTAQLDDLYGHDQAKTLLGQPKTQLVLATTEPEAAERASKFIGDQEIMRVDESRRDHWGFSSDNTTLAPRIVPRRLVLASEIQGLEPLTAYLKLENHVVPLRIGVKDYPDHHQPFVPRNTTASPLTLTPAEPSADGMESVVYSLE